MLGRDVENVNSAELRSALEQHLQETRTHVTRLERVFGAIGVGPKTQGNDILDDELARFF